MDQYETYFILEVLSRYLKVISIGVKKRVCTAGLLKLSKANLKLVLIAQLAIPNTLMTKGESTFIPFVNP